MKLSIQWPAVITLLLVVVVGCSPRPVTAKKAPAAKVPLRSTTQTKKNGKSEPPKTPPKVAPLQAPAKKTEEAQANYPTAEAKSPPSTVEGPTTAPLGSPASGSKAFDTSSAITVAKLREKKDMAQLSLQDYQSPTTIRGIVKNYSFNGPNVTLKLADHRDPSVTLDCGLAGEAAWLKVLPGQPVVLRGQYTPGFDLQKCEVLAVGKFLVPTLTAEELVRESAVDRKAANRKYAYKWLVCTGLVGEHVKDPLVGETAEFVVKSDLKLTLANGWGPKWVEELRAGEEVTVLGRYAFRPDEEPVLLQPVIPYSPAAAKESSASLGIYVPPPDESGPPGASAPRAASPAPKATWTLAELKRERVLSDFSREYPSQWIVVKGIVSDNISRNDKSVWIDTQLEFDSSSAGACCYFEDAKEASRLMPGQQVSVKGRLGQKLPPREFTIDTNLNDCEIVELGKNPVKVLTAEQVASIIEAEDPQRKEKEWVVCTGTFGGFDRRDHALLWGKDDAEVLLFGTSREPFERYSEDDPIRVLGRLERRTGFLTLCIPLK